MRMALAEVVIEKDNSYQPFSAYSFAVFSIDCATYPLHYFSHSQMYIGQTPNNIRLGVAKTCV